MEAINTFVHPYLKIHTKCFLMQTERYNVWIDTGLQSKWNGMQEDILKNGRKNIVLLTHGHWDHIGGVNKIRQNDGLVYGHAADRQELTDPDWQWLWQFEQFKADFDLPSARKVIFWDSIELPMDLDVIVQNGDVIDFDELRFRVIGVPGHSNGSVCYLEETSGTLFAGDSVMGNGFFSQEHRKSPISRLTISRWKGLRGYL